ncbi:MAG: DUF1254 domain-containing protein [Tannerella sp.]|jgi:hypothetical protein|nr:DUF1254 domain-containing protein [Tannerella sp.]
MKKILFPVKYALWLAVFILSSCAGGSKPGLSKDEAVALAREAYLFVTPLVYTDVTRVSSPAPDNRLHLFNDFPDHTFRRVVAPNNDTNYSLAFLDLSRGAIAVELPDTKGRYYVFPLQDAWTNNFFLPGKRTTGTGAQKYLITPPGWTGEVPEGLTQVKSPTTLVWIIGRIQVNSPEDQRDFVYPLQQQFVLKPLSAWQDGSEPAVDPQYPHRLYGDFLLREPGGKSVVEIVRNIPLESFFNYANALLSDNPPFEADSSIVRRIAAIGVGAGLQFNLSAFDLETQEALKQVPADVYAELDKPVFERPLKSGYFGKTTFDPEAKVGDYKTDYNTRALVAYKGLGALPPEEAVYYSYYTDRDGEPLNGKNRYRIHFDKGQLPPAQTFWSYTVYGADRYLVENPIRRYAIGDRNALKYNRDGSLDLYLSRESPGKNRESNWLPTGSEDFNLTLRIYIPATTFLEDPSTWNDPKPVKE